MIQQYFDILTQVRAAQIPLTAFLFEEGKDEEGYAIDLNETKRFQLLKAMQFSRLPTDEPLLAALFEAEIESREKDAFQGMGDGLNLCAALLSFYRNPTHAPLFLRAKFANFDTNCGFDREYIISAGIPGTYQYLQQKHVALLESFYNLFGEECYIKDEELQHWREMVIRCYPDKLSFSNIEDEIDLAFDLDETANAAELISQWEDGISDWTEEHLTQLHSYKRQTGDIVGQIWAKERLYSFKETAWDKASNVIDVAGLYLQLKDRGQAWNSLKQLPALLSDIPDWEIYGLGRFAVDVYLGLVLLINDREDAVAKEAYQWVATNVWNMKNMGWNTLENAAKCGDLMGDEKLSERFYSKLAKEKKDWEDLNK